MFGKQRHVREWDGQFQRSRWHTSAEHGGLPTDTGAQHSLAALGSELPHRALVRRQRLCHRLGASGHQFLQIATRQTTLSERRDGGLLPGTSAQVVFVPHAIGHVFDDRDRADDLVVFDERCDSRALLHVRRPINVVAGRHFEQVCVQPLGQHDHLSVEGAAIDRIKPPPLQIGKNVE